MQENILRTGAYINTEKFHRNILRTSRKMPTFT